MGQGVEDHGGGIAGLLRLLREHEGAVRRDLICAGLRLDDAGTEALSWLDLLAFCKWSPPGSALHEAVNEGYLSAEVHMLRSIEFSLRVLRWQGTEDGHKNRNRPEPLPLESDKPEHQPMSMDEMDRFLGWSPRVKAG